MMSCNVTGCRRGNRDHFRTRPFAAVVKAKFAVEFCVTKCAATTISEFEIQHGNVPMRETYSSTFMALDIRGETQKTEEIVRIELHGLIPGPRPSPPQFYFLPQIWDVRAPNAPAQTFASEGENMSINYSPDGRYIAMG